MDAATLQSTDTLAAAVAVSALIAVIISAAFYVAQRRRMAGIALAAAAADPGLRRRIERMDDALETTRRDVMGLSSSVPHAGEVATVQGDVQRLCGDFAALKTAVDERMDKFMRTTIEDLDSAKGEMIARTRQEAAERAAAHIARDGVSREEFERLRERIERMHGADEVAGRMDVLASLFDSSQVRVIGWQCRLIRMLRGGLAPEAEADLLSSEGIPESRYREFIGRLVDGGIATKKEIAAYYVLPDYEWIYSYVENPDWLQKKLAERGSIKKEKEYQRHVRENLELVEEGLLLVKSEYPLDTGQIDLLCRDADGRTVGIELKYPEAASDAKRQLAGYRADYAKRAGEAGARFVLVAPRIPEDLKRMLAEDGLEYREVAF